jgi:FAD/FMN-containing dehydrogenase
MTRTTFSHRETGTVAHRLQRAIGGGVYVPGDERYDTERRALLPNLDPCPAVVVMASSPADIQAAVGVARSYELPFAVQATGHGTRVPADDGILIKTSGMRSVLVDPSRKIARVGPGARWAQVLEAAAPFGLAPLSGSSPSVGVTGYTLGGGIGWLGRAYGLAADSVLRADVVVADGDLITATPDHHPDLFWALRGGGANFGVVTSLEFRLYPVDRVYGGISYFPIERAAETLRRYREWATTVPDELSTGLLLTRMPDAPHVPEVLRGRRAVAIKAMHSSGDAAAAEQLLKPLRDAAGPALLEGYRVMRYADAAMGGTAARYLDFFDTLPDAAIDAMMTSAGSEDAPVATIEIRHWAGAIARPPADAGPAGHRGSPFSVIVDTPTTDLTASLSAVSTGGTFLNFLGDLTRTASAFTGKNYRRLREIKTVYDPDNFFRLGHNIPPAARPFQHRLAG